MAHQRSGWELEKLDLSRKASKGECKKTKDAFDLRLAAIEQRLESN